MIAVFFREIKFLQNISFMRVFSETYSDNFGNTYAIISSIKGVVNKCSIFMLAIVKENFY